MLPGWALVLVAQLDVEAAPIDEWHSPRRGSQALEVQAEARFPEESHYYPSLAARRWEP